MFTRCTEQSSRL